MHRWPESLKRSQRITVTGATFRTLDPDEPIALLGAKFSFFLPFALLGTNALLTSPAATARALDLLVQTSTTCGSSWLPGGSVPCSLSPSFPRLTLFSRFSSTYQGHGPSRCRP
jgi:hypothetical protein